MGVLRRSGLLHCRTRLPALVLAAAIALSMLQRLALLAVYRDRFADSSWLQIARAFAIGLRFDAVVAGMLVIPLLPILFCAPRGWIERPAFKRSIGALAGALLGLAVLALTIDAFFFGEFNVRLDHKVFSYASGPGNEYLARVIFAQFPVLTALAAVLAVSVGIGWIVARLGFDDRYNAGSTWHAIVWPTLLTALVALGIRGTLGSHAINTGPAYFGATPSLTQLALNGLFTLREAFHTRLTDDVDLASLYDLLPDPEVDRRVRELVLTSADQPIDDPVNPLHRRTEAVRPARNLNVVLVVLEGMHWSYFGHLGGRPGLTPHLDALAEGGVHAEYAFAVGGRTRRGFAGVVSSFPDLPVDSVTTRDDVAGTFLTLPDLLKQRGYQTLFLYGGPALRDHRQTFLGSNGVDRFVVENDLPVRTFRTSLGWNDRDLLRSAIPVLSDLPRERPFFALMLTLTFHRPYEFPGSDRLANPDGSEAQQLAAVRFCDAAIGEFIDAARQQDWFANTVFVFVADHMGGSLQYPRGPWMNRVPMIFYGPGIEGLEPRRIGGVRSQMDVAPTVMGLLGGAYEHTFFGRDLLRGGDGSGYALTVDPDGELSLYRRPEEITYVPPRSGAPIVYRYDYRTGATSESESARSDDVRDAVALVQLADRLFHDLRFNVTPPNAPAHASAQAEANDLL
jgi:hypothetical protein